MYNWNTDTSKWDKKSPSYQIWKQIKLINYGLKDEKLDQKILNRSWNAIKPQIDPLKASVLEYWLWGNLPSLPNYKNGSWNW